MAAAIKGRVAVIRREHSQVAWLAWHIVALDRTKRLPPLDKLMGGMPQARRRVQTPEEMEAAGRVWAASFSIH